MPGILFNVEKNGLRGCDSKMFTFSEQSTIKICFFFKKKSNSLVLAKKF